MPSNMIESSIVALSDCESNPSLTLRADKLHSVKNDG
jgi:hypothetical protein